MNTPRRQWTLILGIALGLLAGTALLRPGGSPMGAVLGRWSYDLLHRLAAPPELDPAECPVVIVYLDVESHLSLRQDPAQRWDRALHTRLMRRLERAGALRVVFDVVFDAAWPDPGVDEAFAAAIRDHGGVIFGAESHQTSQATGSLPGVVVEGIQMPSERLLKAAAGWGLVGLVVDSDFTVRELHTHLGQGRHPVLGWQGAGLQGDDGVGPMHGWTRYYGGPLSIPHISYRNALEPGAVDDSFFKGRVVFVGARPMANLFGQRRDELRNPMAAAEPVRRFSPGVEVHATQALNLLRREQLRRLGDGMEGLVLAGVGIVVAAGVGGLRPLMAGVFGVVVVIGSLVGSVWAFERAGVWFPWLTVALVQVPGAWAVSVAVRSLEWYRQRRLLEAARREAEGKVREQAALIEKAQDAIVVTDLAGRVEYVNPSAGRLFGIGECGLGGELPGVDPAELVQARREVLALGEWVGLVRLRGCGGNIAELESRWTLIRDEVGVPRAVLMINTDVTERRRLEAEVLRASRLEAAGALASGMAHDLNNALAPALLGVQMLRRATTDAEAQKTLAMIEAQTRRGSDMVRQVLHFLRGKAGGEETVSVPGLIRDLEVMLKQTFPAGVTVGTLLGPEAAFVRGNPVQLHQAFLNLCINARDAMPGGGRITLTMDVVSLDDAEAGRLGGGKGGSYVVVGVADSGAGIPAEVLPHIFEPLFTTKPDGRGTGLGLASVARIVRQHSGFIAVDTEPGMGTTFELYLPRVEAVARVSGAVGPGMRDVLVFVPERSLFQMVEASLGGVGYRVHPCRDCSEAGAQLRTGALCVGGVLVDLDSSPDLGSELVRLLAGVTPAPRIVVIHSGEAVERDPGLVAAWAGADVVFLPKPVSSAQLLEQLAGTKVTG